jgi:hypothetical protein
MIQPGSARLGYGRLRVLDLDARDAVAFHLFDDEALSAVIADIPDGGDLLQAGKQETG